jgi:hypothetical protein
MEMIEMETKPIVGGKTPIISMTSAKVISANVKKVLSNPPKFPKEL